MRNLCEKLILPILLGVAFLNLSTHAQKAELAIKQEAQTLEPVKPIKRTLKGGETHSFSLVLKANQFLHVTVVQKGVDVVVSLYSPNGKLIEERDRPNGTSGEESLSADISEDGNYRIEVKMLDEKAKEGTYEIKTEMPRTSTALDKKRISAEKTLQEAEKLRLEQTEELWTKAISKYEAASAIWLEIGDRYAEGLTLSTLSAIHDGFGQVDKAIETELKALSLFREIKNSNSEGDSLFHLARLTLAKADMELASKYYQESAKAKGEAEDKQGEIDILKAAAETFSISGVISKRNGENIKAIEAYKRAVTFYQMVGDSDGTADNLNLIGKVYYSLNNNIEALNYHNQALGLFRNSKDNSGETRTLRDIGLIIPQSRLCTNTPLFHRILVQP